MNKPSDFPMPDWAIGLATKATEIGAQLCTRDGRRIGNAVTMDWPVPAHGLQVAKVLTDTGNELLLTEGELAELFYEPCWLMDISAAPGLTRKGGV